MVYWGPVHYPGSSLASTTWKEASVLWSFTVFLPLSEREEREREIFQAGLEKVRQCLEWFPSRLYNSLLGVSPLGNKALVSLIVSDISTLLLFPCDCSLCTSMQLEELLKGMKCDFLPDGKRKIKGSSSLPPSCHLRVEVETMVPRTLSPACHIRTRSQPCSKRKNCTAT